jgi:hypothetical protein
MFEYPLVEHSRILACSFNSTALTYEVLMADQRSARKITSGSSL